MDKGLPPAHLRGVAWDALARDHLCDGGQRLRRGAWDFEVRLACCASYFFSRTIEAFDLGIDNLRQTDITSILITFCIIILALINLTVFGLSIGRVLAVTVILLAAQFAREAGGAIAGVAAGVAAGILGGSHSFLMGTYGFGGLLAGVFAPLGRLASAGAFILVNLFALLASRAFAGQNLLVEIFIAGVIVMLIPPRLVQSFLHRAPQGEAVAGKTYKARSPTGSVMFPRRAGGGRYHPAGK